MFEDMVRVKQFSLLVDAVVADSPDADIWVAAINLVLAINPSTPPRSSIAPTFKGTPVTTSSSRLADSETADIVERKLFEEIKNAPSAMWGASGQVFRLQELAPRTEKDAG